MKPAPATASRYANLGNMELVAQQFVRGVRGLRSQRAFARRLGYRGNPLTDWEHGRRYPTAEEALRAAALANIDVLQAFASFTPQIPLAKDRRGFQVAGWLNTLCQATSIRELAERSGLSRNALGRWLTGARKPRLPDFLRLVDAATARVTDLVALLVPIAKVPALAARYTAEQAARSVAFEEPWSEAVLRVLETEEYRGLPVHRNGYIAERLGITQQDEARVLQRLELAQVIARRDTRYAEHRPLNVDTRGGTRALHALKMHWAQVAAGRALAPRSGDLFAYSVVSVSRADYTRIHELLRKAYREVRSIVAASEPTDCVALLNLHWVGYNGEPELESDAEAAR
jgi:transcriptional regulator with XRE-family HTH domain